jgi:hypothetical protein
MDWQVVNTAHALLENNASDWRQEQAALQATIRGLAGIRSRVEGQLRDLRNRSVTV